MRLHPLFYAPLRLTVMASMISLPDLDYQEQSPANCLKACADHLSAVPIVC